MIQRQQQKTNSDADEKTDESSSQRRVGKRSVSESKQTRKALLNAAIDVFSERGLYSAKLEEIADRAGVTKGAIYSHFSGREDLLVQACRSALNSLQLIRHAEEAPDLRSYVLEIARVLLLPENRAVRILNVEAHLAATRSQEMASILSEWQNATAETLLGRLPERKASREAAFFAINALFLGLSYKDSFSGSDANPDEVMAIIERFSDVLVSEETCET